MHGLPEYWREEARYPYFIKEGAERVGFDRSVDIATPVGGEITLSFDIWVTSSPLVLMDAPNIVMCLGEV